MKRKNIVLAISLAFVCQASLAANQEDCDRSKDPDCKNTKAGKEKVLPMVSVTANRMQTDVAKYAGQITILDEDELAGSDNIIKNLTSIPGLQTGDDYGRAIGSQFKIRGFGYQSEARVIIEQDGVKRSPSLFSNHISSFRVDSNLLKRVEVVKGASSILHGSGAIGGIISMQTKDARDFINDGSNLGFTIGSRIEDNNLKSGRVAFAMAPENAPFDLLLYGKGSKLGDIDLADGGRIDDKGKVIDKIFNDETVKTGYIKGGWNIAPQMRLSLSAYKYKENLVTTWQTLWHRDPGTLPVHGNLRQTDYTARFTWAPLENPWINLTASAYTSDASYHRIRTGTSRGKPVNIDYVNKDERHGLAIKNESIFNTGAVEHHLVSGFDYDKREENAIFNYNGELSDFGSFPNYYKDFGFYLQDTMDIGFVNLTLGGRYDKFKRGVKLPGREGYSDGQFSPKIAAAFEILDGVNLLAGYAQTFRGPTPNETGAQGSLNPHYWYMPNNDLSAETAKEMEFGISVDRENVFHSGDGLYAKATWFNGRIEDMISLKKLPELGKTPDFEEYERQVYAQYRNVSNARRKGVELEAKYRIGDLSLAASYDYLKLYDGDTGKRLSDFADKISFSAAWMYQPWDLSVGLKATHWFRAKRDKYSYKRWGKTYNYINSTFTIVDFKGQWAPNSTGYSFFDKGFKFNFGVNNILDKKFISPSNTDVTTAVGKGRNIYLEFEKTF